MYRFLVYTFLDVVYLMVGMVVFSLTLKSQQDTLVALRSVRTSLESNVLMFVSSHCALKHVVHFVGDRQIH